MLEHTRISLRLKTYVKVVLIIPWDAQFKGSPSFFNKNKWQNNTPPNILLNPPETLAKNTKKTKTPNARKKMLRPPVESAFSTLTCEESPGGNSLAVL